jgi:hypothetical protein
VTATAPATRRAPAAVRAAAALLVLLVLVSSAGNIYFSFVFPTQVFTPLLVFTAIFLATAATALAAVPGLLRGDRTAWLIALGWTVAYDYWSVYKVFVGPEYESAGFLVAGLLLLALLSLPATRRHAGGR